MLFFHLNNAPGRKENVGPTFPPLRPGHCFLSEAIMNELFGIIGSVGSVFILLVLVNGFRKTIGLSDSIMIRFIIPPINLLIGWLTSLAVPSLPWYEISAINFVTTYLSQFIKTFSGNE